MNVNTGKKARRLSDLLPCLSPFPPPPLPPLAPAYSYSTPHPPPSHYYL